MSETNTIQFSFGRKIVNTICIILCVILSMMLISNLTIIIKGWLSPERPPEVLGITPMIVLSGSMSGTQEGHIEVGDMIFIDKATPEEVKIGDVISFMEGKTVVTHRVIDIIERDGHTSFKTKGDANNTEDEGAVRGEELIGIYKTRIPKLGDIALFLQTPTGMLVFVGLPLLLFIVYDVLRRQRQAKKENEKTAKLEAEIERLQKLANKNEENSEN